VGGYKVFHFSKFYISALARNVREVKIGGNMQHNDVGEVVFKLRNDMPWGYVENSEYPELPAAVAYLREQDHKRFDGLAEFRQMLEGFSAYLDQKGIPKGRDPLLRQGFELHLPQAAMQGGVMLYEIVLPSESVRGPERFGQLERGIAREQDMG